MYDDDTPKPPTYHKYFGYYGNPFYWFIFACVIGAFCAYTFERCAYYDVINAKSVRNATIVDAWPYGTGKYQSGRVQWEGTFRDDVTGHFYTYDMSGGLYQKFLREKSGKGIPVTVYMTPSRAGVPEAMNADNYSVAWDLARIFSSLVTAALLLISLCSLHTSYTYTKQLREAEEERERQRQKDRESYEARTQRPHNARGFQ